MDNARKLIVLGRKLASKYTTISDYTKHWNTLKDIDKANEYHKNQIQLLLDEKKTLYQELEDSDNNENSNRLSDKIEDIQNQINDYISLNAL